MSVEPYIISLGYSLLGFHSFTIRLNSSKLDFMVFERIYSRTAHGDIRKFGFQSKKLTLSH